MKRRAFICGGMAAILASRRAPAFCVAMRNGMMRQSAPTPPLPYDAEVEYVETDGVGSYIKTFTVPDLTSLVNLVFSVRNLSFTGSGNTYNCVCGAADPSASIIICRFGINVSFSNNQFRFNTPNLSNAASDSPTYDNNVHYATIAFPTHGGVSFDGISLTATQFSGSLITSYFCLGAGRDVSNSTIANKDRLFSGTRFYSCKIYTDGVLLFDGIPVRKDWQGYMYDQVSGNLFGNAGTGTITIGPDK